MAQDKTNQDEKKPALSSRLMQMKFMQRGKEKSVLKKAVVEQVKTEDDSKWVTDGAQQGCTVLSEGDPPPGAYMGHMSFSSFNPELQKLQEEREAALKAAKQTASLGADGKYIADIDMAEQLRNLQHSEADIEQEHDQKRNSTLNSDTKRIKSFREGKSRAHKKVKHSLSKSGHKRMRKQGVK